MNALACGGSSSAAAWDVPNRESRVDRLRETTMDHLPTNARPREPLEATVRSSAPGRPSVQSMHAGSIGAMAIGALALGASAIGALAIGRLVVGAFALKRGRVRSLEVDALHVGRLHIREVVIDRDLTTGGRGA